ncbi:MAG: hypothetical protein V7L21_34945 [Nostoc sp.]|uniref:hypothetical protein n=2 Tax=Nostoc TaxID=1177 RepID=UPI0025DB6D65|nr:hypothetical protein [Nostoc sp. NMS9]MBN3940879.1 hypothetical protein [Nostoc sp. NMS9]
MQEIFKKYQDGWQKKWNSHRFSAILVVCLLIWTPLLITETLQIQHSCHPMIAFSKLPAECNTSPGWFPSPLPPPVTPITSNLDAGTIGIAVGATAAALGVPVPIAAGLGMLAWLAAKTVKTLF